MKNIVIIIFLLMIYHGFLACREAQPVNLSWKQNPVDAGPIAYGSIKNIQFECINTGDKPARIRDVFPGCDCTIIDSFSHDWIAPGEQGTVYIHYDTHKGIIGPLRKSLFVLSDGTRDSVSTLYYTGIVTGTK